MRFVSWNVNGLRAAIRKGIDAYFEELDADVTMLQETRTLEEQLPKNWSWPEGWQVTLHPAEKEGIFRSCNGHETTSCRSPNRAWWKSRPTRYRGARVGLRSQRDHLH